MRGVNTNIMSISSLVCCQKFGNPQHTTFVFLKVDLSNNTHLTAYLIDGLSLNFMLSDNITENESFNNITNCKFFSFGAKGMPIGKFGDFPDT